MLEPDNPNTDTTPATESAEALQADAPAAKAPRKRPAKKATPATAATPEAADAPAPAKAARKRPAKKAAPAGPAEVADAADAPDTGAAAAKPAKKAARKTTRKAAGPVEPAPAAAEGGEPSKPARARKRGGSAAAPATEATVEEPAEAGIDAPAPALVAPAVLFVPPSESTPVRARRGAKAPAGPPPAPEIEPAPAAADLTVAEAAEDLTAEPEDVREAAVEEATGARRRRRRGRRGRGGGARAGADEGADESGAEGEVDAGEAEAAEVGELGEAGEAGEAAGTKRRRRRRRAGTGADEGSEGGDLPANTVVHVRQPREADDGVKAVKGSTRLEAKRQRRRDGRETGRRRPPILTEAEFLARREAVDRVMAVRQNGDRTQIAVLEDDILVEHYVTRASATSYVGNVYLGRVQNVLPSMEAAFVDIGKGRNGVLYAGEVNWDAVGLEGKSRAIEQALKSGDTVLVQVTKDPIGHKGARLTSQISLPGRFLVYVPGGGMTGISRKLPDTERHRLKAILKKIVPEDAGVIIRTAAEGASEEDLTRDVERLKAQWEKIAKKADKTSAAPTLVHGEPDLAIRVVRDVFNEDFKRLVVQGEGAWQTVSDYIEGVAPDLAERVSRYTGESDLFHDLRVDEQLMKALDRKVYLPSGGSLVIDRTEAMTVIDVNTGKFVGSGGNLEQTVTRNNIEAAEEIVRQLRLRDVGGIVVIDFIDMVLESNRDLVLRRLTECLGRDRTKHQVAEVTSLGLVQMTRKRVGEGLLEAFSDTCEHCKGRGVLVRTDPVDRPSASAEAADEERPKAKRKRGAKKVEEAEEVLSPEEEERRRAARAAMMAIHRAAHHEDGSVLELPADAFDTFDDGGAVPADTDAAAELEMEAVAIVLEAATIDPEPADAVAASAEVAPVAAPVEESIVEVVPDGAAAVVPMEPGYPKSAVTVELGNGQNPEAEPEPDARAALDEDADAQAEDAEPVGVLAAGPARPRRRRAASRPAGPPVGAEH